MDFSNCKDDKFNFYSGNDKKRAIIYNDKSYMIKYREHDIYSDISEYIGCNIFKSLGFEVQNTILGEYNGADVVACENFLNDGDLLHEFSKLKNSYNINYSNELSFNDIMNIIDNHPNITNKDEIKDKFWKMYIIDSFIANFNRHSDNWGIITNPSKNKEATFSPIYDCGSCLYPKLNENDIDKILSNKNEIDMRIFTYPNSQSLIDKSNYFQTISNLKYDGCNKALKWFMENIDMNKIYNIINSTPKISEKRKKFYCAILNDRFNIILKSSYEKLLKKEKLINEI
jgi:hypothetical protein